MAPDPQIPRKPRRHSGLVEALWRYQIPEDIAERWDYPQITEFDKRQILDLNSARFYGLYGRETVPSASRAAPTARAACRSTRRGCSRAAL